jgi:hypothetical protein
MSFEVEFFLECDDDDYQGMYAVSDRGTVLNLRTEKILNQRVDTNGYLQVNFYGKSKNTSRFVHRLLAKAWIKNTENKPQVDHIDRNKQNNALSNLRWVTCQENMLNRDCVEFSKKYNVSYHSSRPWPSKWEVTWRQDNRIRARYFMTEEEARKFALENIEGKPFLQPIHKPRV